MTPITFDQKQTLLHLVSIRYVARKLIQTQATNREAINLLEAAHMAAIQCGDTQGEALAKIDLDAAKEARLNLKFKIIEIGNEFNRASCHYDQLPREAWLRALGVNESEWDTPDMSKYGDTIRNVVSVLDLENSATREDDIVYKPLKWCTTMAMMNAVSTNPKLGRVMHDGANEMFGGAFGEWKEPTMLEQLGVK